MKVLHSWVCGFLLLLEIARVLGLYHDLEQLKLGVETILSVCSDCLVLSVNGHGWSVGFLVAGCALYELRGCLLRLLPLVREPKAEDEEWEGVVGRIELNIAFEHFNDSSLYLSLTCSFWLLVSRLVFRSLFSLTSNTTTCT